MRKHIFNNIVKIEMKNIENVYKEEEKKAKKKKIHIII